MVFAGEVGWHIVYVVFQVGFWVLDELAWVGFSGLLPDYRYSGFAGVLRGWLGLMGLRNIDLCCFGWWDCWFGLLLVWLMALSV